jgi:hypothetical protein
MIATVSKRLALAAICLLICGEAWGGDPVKMKEYNGPYPINELGMGLSGGGPVLRVNGVVIQPIADDNEDVTLTISADSQKWKLLKEYTPWVDVNRAGYYTDIGTGNNTTLVFSGPRDEGYVATTAISSGARIGLWLLNDTNGNAVFDGNDSYLFSERYLTRNSWANEHQWFMVYDVRSYKYAGASYYFDSPTDDFSFSGDYDYLVFADDDHTSANFDQNDMIYGITCNRPPVATCPGDTNIFLCNLQQVIIPGFSASDPDGNLASTQVNIGTLVGGSVRFTPSSSGNYQIKLIATDTWGVADTCITNVSVNLNRAPDAVSPSNQTLFVCDLSQICIPGFTASDPDGNLVSKTLQGGTLSGDIACFTPVMGANTLRLIATDACGKADTSITVVTINANNPPITTSPANQSLFVCDLSQLCLPGFLATDTDGNLATTVLIGGTIHGDTACFTPAIGTNTLKLIATDACGAADTSITVITVSLNSAPVAVSPSNQTMFVCDLSQICLPGFTATDVDNNILSRVVLGGALSGETACFNPVVGPNTLTFIVTDACGKADTSVTVITVGKVSYTHQRLPTN